MRQFRHAVGFCLNPRKFQMGGHVRLKLATLTIFLATLLADFSSCELPTRLPSLKNSGRSISSNLYYPLNTINHKSCRTGKNDGVDGVCMFVWECMRTGGKHSGMCVDRFMFGSCCTIKTAEDKEISPQSNGSKRKPSNLHKEPSSTNSLSSEKTKPKPYKPGSLLRPMYASSSSSFQQVSISPGPSTSETTFTHRTTTEATTSYSPSHMFPVRGPLASIGSNSTERSTSSTSSAEPVTTPLIIVPPTAPTRPTRPPKPTRPPRPTVTPWWLQKHLLKQSTSMTSTSTTTTSTTTTTESSTSTTVATTTKPTTTNPVTTPKHTKGPFTTNVHSKHVCGTRKMPVQPEGRIVNGSVAKYGEFPWQVSVRRTSFFGFSSAHRCGGALLNSKWVATAGHCVDDLVTTQIRLRVGEYDFSSVMEPYAYIERKAITKIVHPKYNFFTYEHDLALIEMEIAVEFQVHIQPICLPGNGDLLVGEMATVTGWGRLSEHGTLPSVLQHATVPIMSNEDCKNMFLKAGRKEHIPDIFLCAGYQKGGRDSCQGDSGGPLQAKGRDGRWFLAGIISWGIGCAEPNLPGVCTRISKFVPWILEHVSAS